MYRIKLRKCLENKTRLILKALTLAMIYAKFYFVVRHNNVC